MRILALDLALRCGVADGAPGQTPALALIDFGRENDNDADVFARIARWMMRRLRDQRPDLLVVEGPVAKYDKTLQNGMRGVVLGLACSEEVRILEPSVQTWRKYALGFGNMKGKLAKAQCVEMCARLGWPLPTTKSGELDHNAAEAAGIWLYGCARVDPKNTVRHEPLLARSSRENVQ